MSMNTAPHLLAEDRPEFERVLDEALRTAHQRPGLAELEHRHRREALRAMAMAAAVPIASCAAAEYQRLVSLRGELRRTPAAPDPAAPPPVPADAGPSEGGDTPEGPGGGSSGTEGAASQGSAAEGSDVRVRREGAAGLGLAGAVSAGLGDTAGAGAVAVVSVLAPLLAGAAAVIFLLAGYAMHLLSPEPALAGSMRSAGWAFAVLAAATGLAGMAGLLFAAVRNSSHTGPRGGPSGAAGRTGGTGGTGRSSGTRVPPGRTGGPAKPSGGLAGAVAEAREDWREALLERGVVPFLQEALAERQGAVTAVEPVAEPQLPDDHQRTPRLGYSHPDFSSPATPREPGDTATRPRFSSPDFTSPDYGGPEHRPE